MIRYLITRFIEVISNKLQTKLFFRRHIQLKVSLMLFITFFLLANCIFLLNKTTEVTVQALNNNAVLTDEYRSKMNTEDFKNTSKELLINKIKDLKPFVYKDINYDNIPYSERRNNIIEFVKNLYDFLKSENNSMLITDKDFQDIFDYSIKSKTDTLKMNNNIINVRTLVYETGGLPSTKKNWTILQYWDGKNNIVKMVRKESNYMLDGQIVQIINNNPCITLYGGNSNHLDAISESYSLFNNQWKSADLFINSDDLTKSNWDIRLQKKQLYIKSTDPKNIIFLEPSENNIGFSVYDNTQKNSIDFTKIENNFIINSSSSLNITPMESYAKKLLKGNYISTNIIGTSPNKSVLEIRARNYINKNSETEMREEVIKLIDFFYTSYYNDSIKFKGIKVLFNTINNSSKDKGYDFTNTIEFNMTPLNYNKFQVNKSSLNDLLKYANINGSSSESSINPGLLIDKNYANYLTGDQCKYLPNFANTKIFYNSILYNGFYYDGNKIYHKLKYNYTNTINEGNLLNMSNTIAWVKIDASNAKAYNITYEDNENNPIN